jgi:hypothetical protein
MRYAKATDAFEAPIALASQTVDARVGADDVGNAMVAYVDSDGDLLARRFSPAGGWNAAETIAPAPTPSSSPGLTDFAMSASGHAVVAWTRSRYVGEAHTPTFIRVFVAGYGWDAPIDILGGTPTYDLYAGIAEVAQSLRIAAAALVVDTARGNYTAVLGSSYTYDLTTHAGTPGTPVPVFSPTGTFSGYPAKIAVDGAGNALLALYQDYSKNVTIDTSSVWLGRFSGDTWSGATQLATEAAESPTVAANRNGDGLAAWVGCPSPVSASNCAVRVRLFQGGVWQAESQISDSMRQIGELVAAVDGNGRAIVLWIEYSAAGTYSVMASELDPSSGWSAAHAIERQSDSSILLYELVVALGPNGTGIAAWTAWQTTSTRRTIHSAVWRN